MAVVRHVEVGERKVVGVKVCRRFGLHALTASDTAAVCRQLCWLNKGWSAPSDLCEMDMRKKENVAETCPVDEPSELDVTQSESVQNAESKHDFCLLIEKPPQGAFNLKSRSAGGFDAF